jgi:hypothetical protein
VTLTSSDWFCPQAVIVSPMMRARGAVICLRMVFPFLSSRDAQRRADTRILSRHREMARRNGCWLSGSMSR